MTLIGCWRFTGTPTQNGVGNNETTLLQPDSLLHEFKKASESQISETISVVVNNRVFQSCENVEIKLRGYGRMSC